MFLKKHIPLLLIAVTFASCSEYQKVLKSTDTKVKYDFAEKLYEEEDYKRANRIFEQIAPQFVGKPQGERVIFFLADTYYKTRDYNFAGYQYERFLKSYPKSEKASEAAFLGAKSYFMLSPKYSLDQTDTDKALAKLQQFINSYPDSEFLAEANAMAETLTQKKQKKQFEIAKQFTKLGKHYTLDYNLSAIAAVDNFISENPGSIYREEALFLKLRATTELALNSFISKKADRLKDAKEAYQTFMSNYPESSFKKDAENLLSKLEKEEERLKEYESLLTK